MQQMLDKVFIFVVPVAVKIFFALLILLVGKWVAQFASKIAGAAMEKAKLNQTLALFLKNIIYYTLLMFVAIAALDKLGVQTTSFAVLIGAAGLAIGFALQGSLANFASGVMLILFQPFSVGDKVDVGGASGIVKEIQIFSTVIEGDNVKIIVPNAKITADKIVIHKV